MVSSLRQQYGQVSQNQSCMLVRLDGGHSRQKSQHNQHHFRDFTKWFHVSPGGEIIDRAMGTAIDENALRGQQRAEFIRTLSMRPDDPRLVAARARFATKYGLSVAEIAQAARV